MNLSQVLRMNMARVIGSLILVTIISTAWILVANAPSAADSNANNLPAATAAPRGIGALGTLEPFGRIHRIAPPATAQSATLAELKVEEGTQVRRGQLIALLDSHPHVLAETTAALAQVGTAQSRLDLALAGTDPRRIESIEAELAEAKLVADLDRREAQRYGELAKRQTVSTADREDRDSRYQRALMSVKRLAATLEEARTVRPEDIAVARAQVSEAEAALATAKARLALTEILSPIDGTILKIHARAGERVGDKGLAEIGDVSRMAVVAEIYEADMPRVREGATASVRLKTTDLNLRGTVRELGRMVGRKVALDNDPVSDTDARVVEVRIELDTESSAQVTGLSNARVDVVISGDQKK